MQRRVIKEEEKVEHSSHKNRRKEHGWLRLEHGVVVALYISVEWLITS